MNTILAVFKRNLAAYFGSPAGYVFICAFLLASGFAAFWTQEFFNANRANLDQLNQFLPHILLGFIPAITMSIWADERRQGTDELLLTLPGSDLNVVLGKYLGAVAIFTASLFLSLVSNALVLNSLGEPDFGLLFANYVGNWFVGLSMLAIGMVGSFLTANLTVAFVLGVAFNAPLALLSDWNWGIAENYRDFSQGVISLSGIVFFLSIAASMLYLCAILIGRRNWMGNQNSSSRITHYAIRIVAALVIGGGSTFFFRNHDAIRIDTTSDELSKLSMGSIDLLKDINGTVTIDAYVSPEGDFPQEYEQTRINLLNMLRELEDESSGKVRVKVFEIESSDSAAQTAEEEGIKNMDASNLYVEEDGIDGAWDKDIYMGLVFKGAAGKKKLDFLYKGLPVEYELMRNILAAGSAGEKKKVGVVLTDAPVLGSGPQMLPMMGMMSMPMGEGTPAWEFIQELEKQYEVTEVNMEKPIKKEDFDAILVIQPSTLDNEKLDVLLNAIRIGIPTAICEDPNPLITRDLIGTYDPRPNNQQGQQAPPPPKCNLYKLWNLLGIDFNTNAQERLDTVAQELEKLEKKAKDQLEPFLSIQAIGEFFTELDKLQTKANGLVAKLKSGILPTRSELEALNLETIRQPIQKLDHSHFARRFVENLISETETRFQGLEKRILRDRFNPFPKIPKGVGNQFPDEFVYAGGSSKSLSDDEATADLQHLLFTYAGTLFDSDVKNNKLTFKPLVSTAGHENAGTTSLHDFWHQPFIMGPRSINPDRSLYDGNGKSYVIAADIKENNPNKENPLHAIVVADTDFLTDAFFGIRKEPNPSFPLDVDNVTFALNLMGKLLGEKEMMAIRNRRRMHAPLADLEKIKLEAGWRAEEEGRKAEEAFRDKISAKRKEMNAEIAKIIIDDKGQLINKTGKLTPVQASRIKTIETQGTSEIETISYQEQRKLKEATRKVKRKRREDIEDSQTQIKNFAVFLPPIPLLLVALIVFAKKRRREMEGATASRIRGE